MNKFNLSTVFIVLFTFISNAQTITLASAINKAGRQRAITQRMAKDYMMIGSEVRAEDAAKDLDDATALFTENFHDLMIFAKTQDVIDALATVDVLWAKYRVEVTATPNLDDANFIISESTNLMKACNVVVEKLISNSTALNKGLRLPNICGKQRLNLQRISMLYTAKSWGVNYSGLEKDLNESINSFDSILSTLLVTPENTPEINTMLKFQQSEWSFLKTTFDVNSTTLKPSSVYSSTNLMFKDFNNLTSMYEKIASN